MSTATKPPATLAVGSILWWFDTNHRVYRRDADGRATGGPIYREHWRETRIKSETARSWVTERGHKIDKRTGESRTAYGRITFAYSQAEIDDRCWIEENRYALGERVRSCSDVATLRAVAALVGYIESEEERA